MVPVPGLVTVVAPTAPRTRGDGPTIIACRPVGTVCSPHPRGWSLGRAVAWLGGCAAPRTRGDGPDLGVQMCPETACSPHPRGWSRGGPPPDRRRHLLPAPAGMVPRFRTRHSNSTAAPRTRGDGPEVPAVRVTDRCCSPHPRGWSPPHSPPRVADVLLPAPAGMVPPHADRGARPARCSPHPRGWSRRPGRGRRRPGLLPGPARMVPSSSTSGNGVVGHLRVRQPCSMSRPAVLVWTGTIRGGARPDRSHAAWTGHQPPRSMSGTGGGHRQRHVSGFGHSRGYGAGS